MYFGLFLLAPFLNILWHALDINKKKILLLLLLLLGSFASVTNFWWTNYWNSLYPILYYFIGACFKENEFKIKRLPVIVLFLLMITLESIYTYYIQPGQTFDWIINFGGYSCAYNALPTVIASCLIFLLLKDIKINNNFFKKVLKNISQNSLELYLLLCMFADGIIFQPIWKLFAPKVGVVGVYFILVPLEVMVATLAGMALNKGLDILQSKLVLIILKFSKRNK
jgi:surface polysaccharide O-acyltransferase-like enzyme